MNTTTKTTDKGEAKGSQILSNEIIGHFFMFPINFGFNSFNTEALLNSSKFVVRTFM